MGKNLFKWMSEKVIGCSYLSELLHYFIKWCARTMQNEIML